MDYAVETFSLTKSFSDCWGRTRIIAVDDLNLKVETNEVFGLLGPNGSGKTTTIKLLLSLLHPTKGKTLVLGGSSKNPKISAQIGFLPEESYLYKYLTARETLDFYGRLFNMTAKIRKTRTEALLDMVGLKAVANRPVGTYSKGMARRIGLAQALINDPELLILDEPTTGLDPIGTRQIKDLIIELKKRGKTILLCSHLLADVEDVCDRIAILYAGKIQNLGHVKQLLQQTNKTQITTHTLSPQTLGKVKQLIRSENPDCTVTSPMEKLESFFIKTVTKAQQHIKTTAGAQSTTQIGDFLTSENEKKKKQQAILEKLVSVKHKIETRKISDTKKPTQKPSSKITTEPDRRLLDELTCEPASTKTQKPKPTPEPLPEPVQPPEKSQKNILDELTSANNSEQQDRANHEANREDGDHQNA